MKTHGNEISPKTQTAKGNFHFHNFHPKAEQMSVEILPGLLQTQKTISSKFLYDQRGSELFEDIGQLPEYYPTRTEIAILNQNRSSLRELLGRQCVIIEPGSGNSAKVQILLNLADNPRAYMAIDIARDFLIASASHLALLYPNLDVEAIWADYTHLSKIPTLETVPEKQRLVFFPGSTIGNFDPEEARMFLEKTRALVGHGRGAKLLVGVDLQKDISTLLAAYNDSQNVTADFNLNLLTRLNRELGSNFNLQKFKHEAIYNSAKNRIEMHLRSLCKQVVNTCNHEIQFEAQETLHTENSYKYSIDQFKELAQKAGFEHSHVFTDAKHLFSVHTLSA